jgi:hypothetical protein
LVPPCAWACAPAINSAATAKSDKRFIGTSSGGGWAQLDRSVGNERVLDGCTDFPRQFGNPAETTLAFEGASQENRYQLPGASCQEKKELRFARLIWKKRKSYNAPRLAE